MSDAVQATEQDVDLEGLEELVEATTADPSLSAMADALVTPPSTFKRRDDPSLPFYPRGLILDLAMRSAPIPEILEAYKVSVDKFKSLTQHPVFRQDLRDMSEKLRNEGYSFKVKAQAQAEAYLNEAWRMVHDPETPANVRAQIITQTVKWGGLEPKPEAQTQVAVNVDMRGLSNEDLNARVMGIIMKQSPQQRERDVSA